MSRTWRWRVWVTWIVTLAGATLALLAVRPYLDKAHFALAFLLVVLGASSAGGRALGLTIAGLAFLLFNYFFLPPYLTLVISNQLDWLVLLSFLITGAVAAQLLYRANSTAEQMAERAAEIDRLASLGAETLNAALPEDALHAIASVIRTSLGVERCEIFQRQDGDRIVRIARVTAVATGGAQASRSDPASGALTGSATGSATSHATDAVVDGGSLMGWMVQQQQSAVELVDGTVHIIPEQKTTATDSGERRGSGYDSAAAMLFATDHTPAVRALTTILRVRNQTVGMLRIEAASTLTLSSAQVRLLDALTYYAALGVERLRLVTDTQRLESERHIELMRNALLTAVSHDLRTPLTTIKGIAYEVANGADPSRAAIIGLEADRLNNMIGDLLDLSRIQAGAVRPALEINTSDELIGQALQRARGVMKERAIAVEFESPDIVSGRFDLVQSIRILVNLLENAAKYSSINEKIIIAVGCDASAMRIAVMDRGAGVPVVERERIFESFYRPMNTPPDARGTGLGLSIARGLAEAQGGTLDYAPREGGGSVFTLRLPIADALPPEPETT